MQQAMTVTQRECPARRVPSGEPAIIPKGEFITINQARVNQYFDSHLAVETMMYCIQNNDIFSVQYDLSNRDNHQEGQGQENN